MKKGFTLVELLVVIAIIGILVTIALTSFRNSQARARDVERKSDLKQVSTSLNLYYSDYEKYPITSLVIWGSPLTDGKTVYFKELPKDPSNSYFYVYQVDSTNQKFKIFAHLENSQDPNIDPNVTSLGISCGATACNFGISSNNTSPTETW